MPRATAEPARRGWLAPALRAAGAALQRVPRRSAWIPVLLWMGLITWLSSRPGPAGLASGFWAWCGNLLHAPLFGLLALWMALLLPRERGWPRISASGAAQVLAGVVAFGVADELHQHFVARRDLSLLDLVTDLVGAVCTLWIAAWAGRPEVSDAALGGRLLAAAGLCAGAAAAASSVPRFFPGVGWL